MEMSKLREMSIDALKKEHTEHLRELLNIRISKAMTQATKSHHHTRVRRSIARILTVLHEKRIGEKTC